MQPSPETAIQSPPAVLPFRHKGHPLLAWLVIATGVVAAFWLQRWQGSRAGDATSETSQARMMTEMQGRFLVGMGALQGKSAKGAADLTKQAALLNVGAVGQRLRAVIIFGELVGPQEALAQLDRLESDHAEGQEGEQLPVLRRLYQDYQAGDWGGNSVDPAQREELRRQLGWFGELALAPAAGPDAAAREAVLTPARRAAVTLMVFAFVFILVGAAGSIGLLLFLLFFLRGRLRTWLTTGSPAGGVYAETFAIWMFLYSGLMFAASRIRFLDLRIGLLCLASLTSLLALGWPVLRGYSWRQVRTEVGLTAGPRPALEPVFGLVTYALALPLALIGILIMFLLIRIQSGAGGPVNPEKLPGHPIVDALLRLDWWERVQLFILACVIAPLVEETMFRGVLYRHLREATRRMALPVSTLLSATVVSFVFAVIHPQGILGVPVLMGLAYAFNLSREWRGTLVPGMIAHGLNNGIAFTLFLLLMS